MARTLRTSRLSALGLPLLALLALPPAGCSAKSTDEPTGQAFGKIALVVRQHTTVGPDGKVTIVVASGSDQVMDYKRYVPGGRVETYDLRTKKTENLTEDFPKADVTSLDVSFDATKVVFSMRIDETDSYHLYWASLERGDDGKFELHQLTFGPYDDIHPIWVAGDRIAFVTNEGYTEMGTRADEYEHPREVTQLATISLAAGDADRKLCAQNLSHSVNLFSMADGRVGFSRWEHLEHVNDMKLFAMNPDCTQVVAVSGQHGKPANSLVQVTETSVPNVFVAVATERNKTIQSGGLVRIDARSSVDARKFDEEHAAYEVLTPNVPLENDPSPVGRYRTPHALPDGRLLVSWAGGVVNDIDVMSATPPNYGVYLYDPTTRKNQLVLDHDGSWELDAQAIVPRREPPVIDSIHRETDSTTPAVFGSIDIKNTSLYSSHGDTVSGAQFDDTPTDQALRQAKRVRIIEGFSSESAPGITQFGITMAEGAAVIGEAPVYDDGSWLAKVPAYIPMHLQPIDEFDLSIRNQTLWIQGMPGEARVCGGCHESRSAPNLSGGQQMTLAASKGAVNLDTPLDARAEYPWFGANDPNDPNQIQTLLDQKCVSCHNETTNGNGAQEFYTVTTNSAVGGATPYQIPRMDLSSRPITVSYDNQTGSYAASYVSLFYPAAVALELGVGSQVTGTVPPLWAVPSDARGSALIEKLNVTSSIDSNKTAWPLDQAFSDPGIRGAKRTMHPEDVGVTLTREERVKLIRAIDLGGQYFSRRNSDFQRYGNDPTAGH
ncbi:MAG: hypothetical protein OZ921_12095 [Sorangiineae bacterium]|nr:hypothetical protein [Polyangiaceae bacterium]MEB2323246.1 hypothetical protein [Sorangiineae bacterium]